MTKQESNKDVALITQHFPSVSINKHKHINRNFQSIWKIVI